MNLIQEINNFNDKFATQGSKLRIEKRGEKLNIRGSLPSKQNDNDFEDALDLCDKASPYALTGSIFSSNEENIQKAYDKLRFTAGNFYINDKPTGAVVAQQPFGGARASGTNDKAGGPLNLLRWISPRSIKRNNLKIHDWKYPFMGEN